MIASIPSSVDTTLISPYVLYLIFNSLIVKNKLGTTKPDTKSSLYSLEFSSNPEDVFLSLGIFGAYLNFKYSV